ncbi:MAG TPA: hypothetical protein VK528_12170 [Flavobacterium sp.]|nr:hypothetical protein [Flavobacterium sp.]
MSERKNIDKLFQEKFKDFEMNPPEHTWPEIEARLKEKKDRKIIPFWWRFAGIAAALLIGFGITDQLGLFHNGSRPKNSVVYEDNPKSDDSSGLKKGNGKSEIGNPNSASASETAVAASENQTSKSDKTRKNAMQTQTGVSEKDKADKIKIPLQRDKNQGVAVVNVENRKNDVSGEKKAKRKVGGNLNKYNKSEQAIAGSMYDKPLRKSKKSGDANKSTMTGTGSNILENFATNKAVANKEQQESKTDPAKAIQNTTDVKSETTGKLQNQSIAEKSKTADDKANPVAATDTKNQEKKLDSTAIATVVPNALEELLKEKENKVTKEPKLNRWQITSNVAPIYFGSTSKGSPIDSTFAGNSKEYNTNVGFGLGVNYAVNKKFTVRTGINKVSMNYNTNDVQLYAGLQGSGLGNVDTSDENSFLNLGRQAQSRNSSRSEEQPANATQLSTDKFEGHINQKMGYIEVPVEVSYAVIDSKIGVNVIAGVSTLFLNENKIVVISDGLATTLGEANNLNKTHFSSNIGLGVKYSITRTLQANFEPMFKYQLNTFSKDSGNFKPYIFGLYTGLSFRF